MFTDMLYIRVVIFAHPSVLCCPIVLLCSVLAVHLGICSTSSPLGSYTQKLSLVHIQVLSSYVRHIYSNTFVFLTLDFFLCNTPFCFGVTAFMHSVDEVSCNMKASIAVYLVWQVCLRESE